MKIGLLIATYHDREFIRPCLDPWIEYARKNLGSLEICCVYARFAEFEDLGDDGTLPCLGSYQSSGDIKLILAPEGLKEHEARNLGLTFLLSKNPDFILTYGIDEIITQEQIAYLFSYLDKDKLTCWFRISYKNFVGDKNHYVLGFQPPRVFRVKSGKCVIDSFFWDDDIQYKICGNNNNKDSVSYKLLSSKIIPKLLINHYTWLNGKRSIDKINYQQNHFGHCSYKYNEAGEIFFDEAFYKKTGQQIPEIYIETR